MTSAQIEPFASFFMGGFECSTQRLRNGRQLDLISATRHDQFAYDDYALLKEHGIRTARDGLRWHLIERAPYLYDWSSFVPMLRAAQDSGIQVIWDLCHYGIPDGLDFWSAAFVDRFAAFSAAATRLIASECAAPRVYSLINEISYWSWIGGDRGAHLPFGMGRGHEAKRQLVRAAVAGARAVRDIDPGARFLQAEPLINIIDHPDRPQDREQAEAYRLAQFQAWDMIAGRLEPELGGSEDLLDLLGANFYFNNQWIDGLYEHGQYVHHQETMGLGHRLYRPFSHMLREVYERYGRPIVIAETGAEGENGPGWLRYVMGEVRSAMRHGVPVKGVCYYPIMDYPGWYDDRHCAVGLIHLSDDWTQQRIDAEIARQFEEEQFLLRQEKLFAMNPGL